MPGTRSQLASCNNHELLHRTLSLTHSHPRTTIRSRDFYVTPRLQLKYSVITYTCTCSTNWKSRKYFMLRVLLQEYQVGNKYTYMYILYFLVVGMNPLVLNHNYLGNLGYRNRVDHRVVLDCADESQTAVRSLPFFALIFSCIYMCCCS